MTNVVDIKQVAADRRSRVLKEFENEMKSRPGSQGTETDTIWMLEEVLTALGWTVEFYSKSIPDLHCKVDYAAKTLTVNIHKAYYTRLTLERIQHNIELHGLSDGVYIYYWVDAEVLLDKEGNPWQTMILSVRPYSEELDTRELTPEDFPYTGFRPSV